MVTTERLSHNIFQQTTYFSFIFNYLSKKFWWSINKIIYLRILKLLKKYMHLAKRKKIPKIRFFPPLTATNSLRLIYWHQIFSTIIDNFLPFFGESHDFNSILLLWFLVQKLHQVVFTGLSLSKLSFMKRVLQRSKWELVWGCDVRAIRWMHQNFPAKLS